MGMNARIRETTQRMALSAVLSILALGALPAQTVGASTTAATEIASISTGGVQGNDISGRFAGPAISGDGQVVAFDSIATTLVADDTNRDADVFVHDRPSNTTERVSVSSSGDQGNDASSRPALDADGNLVTFDSNAGNLVAGDTNHLMDVFVRNRINASTERVSVSSDEAQGDGSSNSPSISADGRYVAFISTSSNLVPGDTNGTNDVFVRDLVAGTTELVSVDSNGIIGNSSSTATGISGDGRWVAFSSFANNLVPGDTNDSFDVFIHDRVTGSTQLVSQNTDGVIGDAPSSSPAVSGDGRYVAFWSSATNLVPDDTNGRDDAFVRDILARTTERVSIGNEGQQGDGNTPEPGVRGLTVSSPDITPDGRYVAFFSSSTNLVAGDTNTCPLFFDQFPGQCPDAFVRDRVAGTTVRVNLAPDGTEANDRTADAVISDDGTVVAFFSAAANLVAGDRNTCPLFDRFPGNCPDIIVHDEGGPAACTISGTPGSDFLEGTSGDDRICGGGGNDTMLGRGGDDVLFGRRGGDTIVGGAGSDVLVGGSGADVLRSDDHVGGNDTLTGGPGLDTCVIDEGDVAVGCEKVISR
jgi:Tol biopolymer transport system component